MNRVNPLHSGNRRRRVAAAVVLSLSALLFSACSASSPSVSDQSGGNAGIPGVPDAGVQKGEIADGQTSPETDRHIISTGSLGLTSPDPRRTADEVARTVAEAGGRIDSRTDSPALEQNRASAHLVARIPSADLDTVMEDLEALGEVTGSSVSQTDVTAQAADLDARIEALSTSIDRLLTLMSQATTTADLIEIESTLSERQAELDGLTAQRDAMADQVDFASIQVDIRTPAEVAGAAPGDFWGGVVVGFSALGSFFSGLLVVLGILLPWLVVAAVVAAIVWLVVRWARSRRAPSVAAAPAGEGGHIPPRPPLPSHAPAASDERKR